MFAGAIDLFEGLVRRARGGFSHLVYGELYAFRRNSFPKCGGKNLAWSGEVACTY